MENESVPKWEFRKMDGYSVILQGETWVAMLSHPDKMDTLLTDDGRERQRLVLKLAAEIVADANLGAEVRAEEEVVDPAFELAMEEARQRTPAQSADGFLRDALVMISDRRYQTQPAAAVAVTMIGKALRSIAIVAKDEELAAGEVTDAP